MHTVEKARILLIDSSQIVLDGLELNLNKLENYTIDKALGKNDAIAYLQQNTPRIVILGNTVESDEMFQILDTVITHQPLAKIIIYCYKKDVHTIVSSIRAGAHAYLPKDATVDEILSTVDLINKDDGIFLSESIPSATLQQCFQGKPVRKNFAPYHLTEREIEIIELIAKGFLSKEIAEVEHLNVSTIETHKENIKAKLGLKSIMEVVVFSIKNGVIFNREE